MGAATTRGELRPDGVTVTLSPPSMRSKGSSVQTPDRPVAFRDQLRVVWICHLVRTAVRLEAKARKLMKRAEDCRTSRGATSPSLGGQAMSAASTHSPLDPRLLALLARWQFELNCLSSVSIEVPALRPATKRLREALGG